VYFCLPFISFYLPHLPFCHGQLSKTDPDHPEIPNTPIFFQKAPTEQALAEDSTIIVKHTVLFDP
jgi:hypothetical protein